MPSRWQCLVLLTLALPLTAMPVLAADRMAINAVVGFNDIFRPGRWTPLSVTVTNHGDGISGELAVQITGGDPLRGKPYVTTHRRALDLDRDARKTLHFTVFPQSLSHPLLIRVTAGGRDVAQTQVDLHARFTAGRLLLVLSRDGNLDYLNDGIADGLRVLYPHPERLPVHWRGYDAVAAMVINGVSLERLSERQFEALHKWIAQGGTVAVSGGADYALLRSQRLAALLPGLPSGMRRVDGDVLRQVFSASLDVSRPVQINRLDVFRGRTRLRAGDAALIVERTLGRGRVLYLTFDVTSHPFNRWDGMSELLRDSLSLRVPATVPVTAVPGMPESPLPHLIQGQAREFPSHAVVVFFLTLYLGWLLAGQQLTVGGKWQRCLAPFARWAAPLLFAPAAWLLFGPAMVSRGATAVTMAVIEPLPDSIYARLGLDVGVYANRSGAWRLAYRGVEPVWYPPRQLQHDGEAEDWVLDGGPRPWIEPADQRRYVLHRLQGEDVIAFYVGAAVSDEREGPRLVLDNASGRQLQDVWLVFDGYAYPLQSLASGARVERQFTRHTHGRAVGEAFWHKLFTPNEHISERMLVPARIALESLAQRAGDAAYPAPGHALLVGYTGGPLQPAGVSAGWPRCEQALVALQIAVQPATGSRPARATMAPGSTRHSMR